MRKKRKIQKPAQFRHEQQETQGIGKKIGSNKTSSLSVN